MTFIVNNLHEIQQMQNVSQLKIVMGVLRRFSPFWKLLQTD